jgi:hypothetical protein
MNDYRSFYRRTIAKEWVSSRNLTIGCRSFSGKGWLANSIVAHSVELTGSEFEVYGGAHASDLCRSSSIVLDYCSSGYRVLDEDGRSSLIERAVCKTTSWL